MIKSIQHKQSLIYIFSALILTIILMLVQFIAAYKANSLALLADGTHLFIHNSSLIVALVSSIISYKLSKKESNKAIIADIVGGMINCSIFIAIAIVIILHSIHRLEHHHLEIDPTIISTVGIFGFAIHCISAFILSKGRKHSFNIHAIFLHTFFDCISTIITFCSGIIILATDFEKTDSIASFIIASLILFSGLRLLKKCIKKALFLHKEIALKGKIEKYLLKNIHHINNLHACEITFENNLPIYSAHVVMSKDCKQNNYQCIEQITNLLKQEFKITKSIIQIEDC